MKRSKLDKIDKKILKHLQENGRITNVDLAKSVGISAPPCLRRVRALEEAGYIKSYHAQVETSALGYGVEVYAMVKLTSQADKDLVEFETFVDALPMVRECHMLAGDYDFLLKIVARDWAEYQKFYKAELTSAAHVLSVTSYLGIRTTKKESGVPIEV